MGKNVQIFENNDLWKRGDFHYCNSIWSCIFKRTFSILMGFSENEWVKSAKSQSQNYHCDFNDTWCIQSVIENNSIQVMDIF